MKFPNVSTKVIVAVVAILIVLFFFRRGEKYDVGAIKSAFGEAGVSIEDENILGPLLEKGPENLTDANREKARKIMNKYPGLGMKIENIYRSSEPSPSVSNMIQKAMTVRTPQKAMPTMTVRTPQAMRPTMGMAPPRKFTCTFDN